MFGLILYAIIAFVIALTANWVRSLFTKTGSIGDAPAAGRILVLWLVVMAMPYGWVEFQTARHKTEFDDIVDYAAKGKKISGDVLYTKVQHLWGGKAKLLVVTQETEEWGGTYRDLYQLVCTQDDKNRWELEEVRPINTSKGDSAGFVFPPYW